MSAGLSLKGIAVPPRNAGRKRAPLSAPPSLTSVRSASAPATGSTPRHRFAIGDRLSMASGGRETSRHASGCVVVAMLPFEGSALRYRVRSDNETFERVVDEIDLSAATPTDGLD